MRTDIIYRDVSRTDGLEQFILEHTQEHIETFFQKDDEAHLTVRIELDRHRVEARKPHYTCELLLKPTHSKKMIKVQKADKDFKICISKAIEALKIIIRKDHDKKTSQKKTTKKRDAPHR